MARSPGMDQSGKRVPTALIIIHKQQIFILEETGRLIWRQAHARRLAQACGKGEGTAFAQFTCDGDRAAHHLAEALGNSQPESGASKLSGHGPISL